VPVQVRYSKAVPGRGVEDKSYSEINHAAEDGGWSE